ncbi:scavenger receptor class B member 1 [Aplochiton taeniatus]
MRGLCLYSTDSPVFISHPHFYNADPVLLDYVQGLRPTEDQHGLFIDIHPETGVPLNVSIRLQLNLYMKTVPGITETGKISEVVMPMIWFEESGYIDGPILTTFHTNLVVLPMVMEYMQYGFIGLGLATVLGAVLLALQQKASDKDLINGSDAHETQKDKFIMNDAGKSTKM